MNIEDFDIIMSNFLTSMDQVLGSKAKEYAIGGDRFHNFKVAAAFDNCTPEKALWGILLKHLVSIRDICHNPEDISLTVLEEKTLDTANYMVLLNAMVKERIAEKLQVEKHSKQQTGTNVNPV